METLTIQTKKRQVVFILCVGHSGSTLLDLILGSHSSCASLGEFHLAKQIVQGKRQLPASSSEAISPYWKQFATSAKAPFYHNAMFDVLKKEVLIDSSKSISWALASKKDIHAKVKYIRLLRDGPGTLLEAKRKRGKLTKKIVLEWQFFNRLSDKFLKNISPEDIYTLRYEDLTTDPEKTIRKVCAFLSLSFEPSMLKFWRFDHHALAGNTKTKSLASFYQKKLDSKHPETQNYIADTGFAIKPDKRYLEKLSQEDFEVFGKYGGALNQKYGYKAYSDLPKQGPLMDARLFLIGLKRNFVLFRGKLREKVIAPFLKKPNSRLSFSEKIKYLMPPSKNWKQEVQTDPPTFGWAKQVRRAVLDREVSQRLSWCKEILANQEKIYSINPGKISIIVLSCKRWGTLGPLIQSFRDTFCRLETYEKIKKILVDNGSGPELLEKARATHFFDREIIFEENKGLLGALREAYQQIDSEYILLLEDDFVADYQEPFLEKCLSIFNEYPEIGLIRLKNQNNWWKPHRIISPLRKTSRGTSFWTWLPSKDGTLNGWCSGSVLFRTASYFSVGELPEATKNTSRSQETHQGEIYECEYGRQYNEKWLTAKVVNCYPFRQPNDNEECIAWENEKEEANIHEVRTTS